jgi:hypothetical protein
VPQVHPLVEGICHHATRFTNPVLDGSELSWSGVMSCNARHEFLVQFTHKPNAKRELFQARDSMFQSDDIVANLAKVFWAAIYSCTRFSGEQLTERGLSALDFAGKHSLASHEWADENVRVGKASPLPRQPANKTICLCQNSYEQRSPIEDRW